MPDPAVAAPAVAATPPTATWYEGKATPEQLGFWQNKGYNAADPITVAIEATKSAMQAQSFIGAPPDQILRLPKGADDADGWKAVYARLGVPNKAEDYDFTGVKFGDNDLEPGFASTMRGALHKAGVIKEKAPDVVRAVVKYLADAEAAEAVETTAKRQTERAELLKNWGTNAEFNRLTAMQGAKRVGATPEDVARFESVLGYDRTMELFRRIGAGTTEDTFVESKQGGPPTTVNSAKARMAELEQDREWVARFLKGGAQEKREWHDLQQLIHGEAA
jgi:hypothetical protein